MKKIIIIGATSGIGKELARLYATSGNRVGITGRRDTLLKELQREFQGNMEMACFDVTGNENTVHLEKLIDSLGGLDLLIYNSGYGDVSKDLDWKIEKQTTLTNVNGFVEMVNVAFCYFIKQGHGQIAGTSSVAANRGNPGSPAYSASKSFMSIYLEGLKIKALKSGLPVYVTDIQPGFVKTKMAKVKRLFWVTPLDKAARQIYRAIEKKKRKAYISRRWKLIAWLMRFMPFSFYSRIIKL